MDEINPLKNLEDYQPSVEYIQKCGMECGMEWEVKASSIVIDSLGSPLDISENKVVAIGFSEAGHLAVKLAAENKRITHLVSVFTNGLNQFYSSIVTYVRDKALQILIERDQISAAYHVNSRSYSADREFRQ